MSPRGKRSTRIHRSALVPFGAQSMFDLVADVSAYPEFLPWCAAASIGFADARQMEATLEIARGPISKAITTRNSLEPPGCIRIHLLKGPFRRLEGCWSFEDLGVEGARVSLEMDFEVAGAILGRVLTPVFGEIANSLVDAFCQRARALYETRGLR